MAGQGVLAGALLAPPVRPGGAAIPACRDEAVLRQFLACQLLQRHLRVAKTDTAHQSLRRCGYWNVDIKIPASLRETGIHGLERTHLTVVMRIQ